MSMLSRTIRDAGKRQLRRVFEVGQRLGVDILPRHFYSEIPDLRGLKRGERWKEARSMVGVSGTDPGTQMEFVRSCCPADLVGRLAKGDIFAHACGRNGEAGFGPVEADFLYAFTRVVQPRR